jgi:hypothetical protein
LGQGIVKPLVDLRVLPSPLHQSTICVSTLDQLPFLTFDDSQVVEENREEVVTGEKSVEQLPDR